MSAANLLTAIPAADRITPPARPEPRAARPDNPGANDRSAFRDELDRASQGPAERGSALNERGPSESAPDSEAVDAGPDAADATDRVDSDAQASDVEQEGEAAVAADTNPDAEAADDTGLAQTPVDSVAAEADELVASLAGLAQTLRDAQRVASPQPLVDTALAAAAAQNSGAPQGDLLAAQPVLVEVVNPAQNAVLETPAQELTTAAGAASQTLTGSLNTGVPGASPGFGSEAATATTAATAAATSSATPAAASAATAGAASASRGTTEADRGPRPAAPGSALGLAPGAVAESTEATPSADASARPAVSGPAAAALPATFGAGGEALAGDAAARPAGVPTGFTSTPAGLGAGSQEVADADAQADDLNAARLSRALNSAVKQNGGGLTLRLTPAALGTVRIDLQLQGASVSADFVAESEAGGRLLNRQLVQLRSVLESQGLNVERLGVQVKGQAFTGGSGPQSDGQPGRQDQPSDQARSNASDAGGGQSRGRERSDAEAQARRDASVSGRTDSEGSFSRLFGDE